MFSGEGGDLCGGVLLIGVDADDLHAASGEFFVQLVQVLGVEASERTFGAEEDECEELAPAKVAEALDLALAHAELAVG